uniref:Uncharacterized protein n=1 Tax=Chromera velia CCMP2878 TaxID=1169474 RepID=A0A0G4I868_9ALVE|eukprot:Cvel_11876.t1-p1 / transcript=Cvel_11876.t1 / gene=Cvel_11876 / organism=Chromera_velia_CCMP2878 / gene_product=hypothetical protein / transcript_product=hypothetical protein / location=Cvel_scaffold758:61503-62333(+) / protein_length=277 / sequence_SO=supercontig / SO=protein_coding / is_pseudo=false
MSKEKIQWLSDRPPACSEFSTPQKYGEAISIWAGGTASVKGLQLLGDSLMIMCLECDESILSLVQSIQSESGYAVPQKGANTDAEYEKKLRDWAKTTYAEPIKNLDLQVDEDSMIHLLFCSLFFMFRFVSIASLSLRESLECFSLVYAEMKKLGVDIGDKLAGILFSRCVPEEVKRIAPLRGNQAVAEQGNRSAPIKSSLIRQKSFFSQLYSRTDMENQGINRKKWVPSVLRRVLKVSDGKQSKEFKVESVIPLAVSNSRSKEKGGGAHFFKMPSQS